MLSFPCYSSSKVAAIATLCPCRAATAKLPLPRSMSFPCCHSHAQSSRFMLPFQCSHCHAATAKLSLPCLLSYPCGPCRAATAKLPLPSLLSLLCCPSHVRSSHSLHDPAAIALLAVIFHAAICHAATAKLPLISSPPFPRGHYQTAIARLAVTALRPLRTRSSHFCDAIEMWQLPSCHFHFHADFAKLAAFPNCHFHPP